MARSVQRQVLPIPDRAANVAATYDAKDPDTSFPPIEPLLPPEGAPNVLIVLIDDCGFGASSAFGGPVQTRRRSSGSPARGCATPGSTRRRCARRRGRRCSRGGTTTASGMGGITEIATSAPGYNSLRPNDCAPLAETLKLNGYCTAQFGKCHEVPVWQTSPMGPVRQLARRRRGVRVLLRLHRRRDQPVRAGALREPDARGARPDAGGGLPPDRGHDRPRDLVGAAAEGADAGQAVLRLLRAGCDARAPPRRRPSGRTSTAASSTRAGTRCARRPSPARRSSVWCRSRRS